MTKLTCTEHWGNYTYTFGDQEIPYDRPGIARIKWPTGIEQTVPYTVLHSQSSYSDQGRETAFTVYHLVANLTVNHVPFQPKLVDLEVLSIEPFGPERRSDPPVAVAGVPQIYEVTQPQSDSSTTRLTTVGYFTSREHAYKVHATNYMSGSMGAPGDPKYGVKSHILYSSLEAFAADHKDLSDQELSYFTYKRTYSRAMPDGTSEEFWQTCRRVAEGVYNMQRERALAKLTTEDRKALGL